MVEGAIGEEVIVKNHRPEITDGRFLIGCVERDLGAEVAAVNNANVILWAAEVAWVLECNPWVAGLENHFQHRFPEVERIHFLTEDFSPRRRCFVFFVACCEGSTIEVVKVRNIG